MNLSVKGANYQVNSFCFDRVRVGPFIRGKIRRELYHLYQHVFSTTKRARTNGSRLISVLDSFSCMWMLPVATAIQHGARFKVTAPCCDLPQSQYFQDLLNENGRVFYYDKNPHLPRNSKKQCSLEKNSERAREKREEGDWLSGLSVTSKMATQGNES